MADFVHREKKREEDTTKLKERLKGIRAAIEERKEEAEESEDSGDYVEPAEPQLAGENAV